jgi:proteasome lid subunit RPN8/RPN11
MALFQNINRKLAHEMGKASSLCGRSPEEEGGIILEKDGEYAFVKVKNKHSGDSIAEGLYETDLEDLQKNVFPMVENGWKFYASFHTHPSFSPTPSKLDLEKLFTGFKYNVIFASQQKVFSYSEWLPDDRMFIYYIPLSSLILSVKNEN